jgi:hypothetical protein
MDMRLSGVLVVLGIAYWLIGRLVMSRTKDGQASVENHYHTVFLACQRLDQQRLGSA